MHPPNVNQDKNYQRLYQSRIETLEKNAAHHDLGGGVVWCWMERDNLR
jgi:hypothetical protein